MQYSMAFRSIQTANRIPSHPAEIIVFYLQDLPWKLESYSIISLSRYKSTGPTSSESALAAWLSLKLCHFCAARNVEFVWPAKKIAKG